MNLSWLYFSLYGRLNRRQFWRYGVTFNLLGSLLLGLLPTPPGGSPFENPWFLVGALLTLWPSAALALKRLHDRGKGAGWLLLMFVPVLGPLWLLLECGFFPGQEGDNRFGPVPHVAQPRLPQLG